MITYFIVIVVYFCHFIVKLTIEEDLHYYLHKRSCEVDNNQIKEVVIVVVADTVVHPNAMMIKILSTPITSVAVLSFLFNMTFAFVTVKLIWFIIKWKSKI